MYRDNVVLNACLPLGQQWLTISFNTRTEIPLRFINFVSLSIHLLLEILNTYEQNFKPCFKGHTV